MELRISEKSPITLSQILEHVHSLLTEIEIEGKKEKLQIPSRALELLNEILKAMSQGNPISIVPVAKEVTTQKGAKILECSRSYFVKLLENGELDFIKVGRHRRIKFEDVIDYKQKMKAEQKSRLIQMMNSDEELGGYGSQCSFQRVISADDFLVDIIDLNHEKAISAFKEMVLKEKIPNWMSMKF